MRSVAAAGIALLAQRPSLRRAGKRFAIIMMEDSLTGAVIGEMTVIVRDQVDRNGAFDVFFSANGVDCIYSHRALTPAVFIDGYALRQSGEILEIERSLVLPSDDLKGTA